MRTPINTKSAVLSVGVQAKVVGHSQSQPNQFWLLVGHLLDRFFNNDMVTVGGDTLPLIMTIAGLIAIPTLIAAVFAYPPYHAFPPRPPIPPYWDRTAEHLLYVTYSFVAMGAVTVFEADLLFPNLLDILILSTLPIPQHRMASARVTATLLFLALFLVGINSLGTFAYPSATEFHAPRLMWAHFVAVMAAGIFSSAVFLALQGILICLLRGRMCRAMSVVLQGASTAALLAMLFLFPAIYPHLRELIQATGTPFRYFPPFWFLGIYECALADPNRSHLFARLALMGWWAVSSSIVVAVVTYPLAYVRRTKQALEGTSSEGNRVGLNRLVNALLNTTILRSPSVRAVYHFIGQTVRTLRHRVYLAMYAGLGTALIVLATVDIQAGKGQVAFILSPYGLRLAVPGVACWVVSGLSYALLSPADPSAGWVFRVIDGKPTPSQLDAVRLWVKMWSVALTLGVVLLLHLISPAPLRKPNAIRAEVVVAIGVCLLLPEILLFTSQNIPFTEARIPVNTDLAFALLRYVVMYPVVVAIAVVSEHWMESKLAHLLAGILILGIGHEAFQNLRKRFMGGRMASPELYEAGGVIQALGLRE